jgi:dihydroxy-acid dehydratase
MRCVPCIRPRDKPIEHGYRVKVLHLLAIARAADVPLTIDDFQAVADRTPYLADLKPSGKYVMEDVHRVGGIPSVVK